MIVIGITGTNASGKGTVVEILQNIGFQHLSVRDYIAQEIIKRGLEVNRANLIKTANSIREENGPSFIVKQLYEKAKELSKNVVIESIRTVGEVEELRKNDNFILIAVDADERIRYERAVKRNSNVDQLTFEEFVKLEKKEMVSEDKGKQNLLKCIDMADVVINNDGTIKELEQKVRDFINARIHL